MNQKLKTLPFDYPIIACLLAGIISAFAMAPTYYWPLMLIGLSGAVLVVAKLENPLKGAWCAFAWAMGFFTISLYWVGNALKVDASFGWAIGFAMLGLPFLLAILWFLAGYASVRFSKSNSLARGVLFLTMIGLAEFARAFNFSGFPWNLFGYMWAPTPIAQTAALGGAYFTTIMTILWMGTPALWYLAHGHQRIQIGIIAAVVATLGGSLAYGIVRLETHPTELRDDAGIVIVQPNISAADKWKSDKLLDHFLDHVRISRKALDSIGTPPPTVKSITVVWPETSIDGNLVTTVPAAPKALLDMMSGYPFRMDLVSGMMRDTQKGYYNSIALISVADGKLSLDAVYDKHHLVPFGEYLPFEKVFNLTPLVGFSGFQKGPGPRTLHGANVPPFAPMICFEAIFPWYGNTPDAAWFVNTSNDGWYGDTAGPYQHLVMTQFRAIERGKPIIRAATTGISAVIDSMGRPLQTLEYDRQGFLVSALPKTISGNTVYSKIMESLFFFFEIIGFLVFALLRRRNI